MPEAEPMVVELHWNIMSRFREYVRHIPDGSETWVSEVGGISGEGLLFIAPEQPELEGLPWRFTGAVRYEAYRGALRVDISDPEISETDNGYLITVNTSPPGVAEYRIPMATAHRGEMDGDRIQVESTALTTEGAGMMGGVYQGGEPADGFSVRLRQNPGS